MTVSGTYSKFENKRLIINNCEISTTPTPSPTSSPTPIPPLTRFLPVDAAQFLYILPWSDWTAGKTKIIEGYPGRKVRDSDNDGWYFDEFIFVYGTGISEFISDSLEPIAVAPISVISVVNGEEGDPPLITIRLDSNIISPFPLTKPNKYISWGYWTDY